MRRISVQRWLICLVAGLMIVSLLLPVACAKPAPAPAPPPAPAPTPAPAPAPAPPPAPKVFEWDYCSGPPSGAVSAYTKYTKEGFADIIDKATNGRLKITHHEGLIPAPQVIDGVRDRTVDIGLQQVTMRGEMGLYNYPAMPHIPIHLLAEIQPYVKPILMEDAEKTHDVIMVGYGYWGNQIVIANKPLPTLEDLQKVKIRVHIRTTLELLEAAGCSPITIPMGELYLALQRGVADGAQSSTEGFMGNKLYEPCKYISYWPLGSASYAWVVNKQSWAELPADLQDIVLDTFVEKINYQTLNGAMLDDWVKLEMMVMHYGVEVTYPEQSEIDKLMASAPVAVEGWKKRAGPRADEVMAIINAALEDPLMRHRPE